MQTTHGDDGGGPWHHGERHVQDRAGVAEQADKSGRRGIRGFLIDQHRDFFAQLPFMMLGAVDRDGWPWASILVGPPGFVSTPDSHRLRIAALPPAYGAEPVLALGDRVGLLGIDFASRRRNRANGHVAALDSGGFTVAVEQSYGNCPKYIQPRDLPAAFSVTNRRVEPFSGPLGPEARALIARADTAFVASAALPEHVDGKGGVDVSHRGGPPGFIEIDAAGTLLVPDYAGNRYFNTLGNLSVNPRAGLLFADLANGDVLQVVGRTEILWEGADIAIPPDAGQPSAERFWRFQPSHGRWLHAG